MEEVPRMARERTSGENGHAVHVLEVVGNAIVGGMERYVEGLVQHLAPQGFRFTCLSPYESAFTASLRARGCEVFVTPMFDDPYWPSIQLAAELVRHLGIDVLHAHMPRAHVLAGLAGCVTGVPAVATVHVRDVTAQVLGIARTTGTHQIVVCQAAYLRALALGLPPEQLTLVPNGVDVKAFTPGRDGSRLRANLGVPADAPLVGFVGRLSPEKGPDLFVRMAEHVHRRRPDVHFVLVGEGPLEAELAGMVQAMRLHERVHLAGAMTAADAYPALDLLAQTSHSEGMPLVLLEAMACGLPVVAIGTGGVLEVVEAGSTGLLASSGDWVAVGEAVLELLREPGRRRAMGQAGRRRVEEHFRLETSTRRTGEVLRRLARRGAGAERAHRASVTAGSAN
jgi:glycosyltransferase involved in cell wall biosynthesis